MNSTLEKLEKKLLHYVNKAVSEYGMIEQGDRIMVCLSGGKDSYTLLYLLNQLRLRSNGRFNIAAYTLDQSQPGWDDQHLRAWLDNNAIPYTIEKRNTYGVVIDKIPDGKSYCSLCSRLRRGNIYRFASENGFTKIALGHHRDDLIETLLMSVFYSGQIRTMPPKLLTDNREHIVIRPLVYCQEADIAAYAKLRDFPIIPCNLCGSQENLKRQKMKELIAELARENPKVPSNILGAIGNVQPSQLMDKELWDFKSLDIDRQQTQIAEEDDIKEKGPAAVSAI